MIKFGSKLLRILKRFQLQKFQISVSFNTVSNFLIKNDFDTVFSFRKYNEATSIYRAKFVKDLNNRIIDLDKAYVMKILIN